MDDKWIRINGDIHRQVKVASAMSGQSIKDWVEKALTAALPDRARVLIDSGV